MLRLYTAKDYYFDSYIFTSFTPMPMHSPIYDYSTSASKSERNSLRCSCRSKWCFKVCGLEHYLGTYEEHKDRREIAWRIGGERLEFRWSVGEFQAKGCLECRRSARA